MGERQRLDKRADLEDLRQSIYALRLLIDALAVRTTKADLLPLVERIQAAVRQVGATLDRLDLPSPPDNA